MVRPLPCHDCDFTLGFCFPFARAGLGGQKPSRQSCFNTIRASCPLIFSSAIPEAKSPAETAVFDALLQRLEKDNRFCRVPGVGTIGQILIDESLTPGDDWRMRLFEWAFQANHGILFCTALLDAEHIAEMRNWLYTEATLLAGRRIVGQLASLFVIGCGTELKTHPFGKLDALLLGEVQELRITGPGDVAALDKVMHALEEACAAHPHSGSGQQTSFDEYHEQPTSWLRGFGNNVLPSKLRMTALQRLHIAFLDWDGRFAQHVSPIQDKSLALRLLEGPMAPPQDYPDDPTIPPYRIEHVDQWDQLLRWKPRPCGRI